jgi:hypothetical protein
VRRDDAELVDAFMQSLASAPEDGRPLPDAQLVLRRADLRARLEAEERRVRGAALPLLAAALLGPCAVVVALGVTPTPSALVGGLAVIALAGTLAVRLALIED